MSMTAHDDLTDRMDQARKGLSRAGFDALLVTPGPDLRYLTGYDALPLERLTCLVLSSSGGSYLVVPAMEEPAVQASPASQLGLQIMPCLLYTSDAADEEDSVDLGGRRII